MMLTSRVRGRPLTRRKLEDLRVVEFVGHFSLEALLATDRTHIFDTRRETKWHLLLPQCLMGACSHSKRHACDLKGNPTDVDIIDDGSARRNEEKE
jgi:hypothetical protein